MREEKLYFRPNGSFIEFVKGDKNYFGFLLRRTLAMCIDLIFFAIMLFLLYAVLKIQILLAALFILIGINVYVFTSCMMLGNRTIGMYFTKLKLVNTDGSEISKSNRLTKLFFRSTMWSFTIVCVPLSVLYFVSNLILSCMGRTIFVIDKLLKLQIVTKHASDRYTRLMSEWNDEDKSRLI